MSKNLHLSIQKWGNSLAVRIPVSIARSAHLQVGTQVELTLETEGVLVRSIGNRPLTLEERLDLFDPQKHAGEAMVSKPIGLEKFE